MPCTPSYDPIEQMRSGRLNDVYPYHNWLLDVSQSQEEM